MIAGSAALFIVWQEQAVKGRGGGPFLVGDPPSGPFSYAPPWRGLRCEHHGGGRAEWTPLVVESERRDGQLRQNLVYRLPTIRSCCIDDDFHRAAWWHDVEWAVKLWGELGEDAPGDDRDRATILADLREVIRKPTPAGIRDFAAFRSQREAEDEARDEANRLYWERQVRQNQKQVGDDHERRPPDCFAALSLKADATLDQVKARHRELVKKHHPDRGGDSASFRRIQDAYERALADLERRSARSVDD